MDHDFTLLRNLLGNGGKTEWNYEIEIHTVIYPSQVLIWAHHYCDCVVHLEYANSWRCMCLLVLVLHLGGHLPTELPSLSAVCLQTPVILPHTTTFHQSYFSGSRTAHVWSEAVGLGWDVFGGVGRTITEGKMCWVFHQLFKTKVFFRKNKTFSPVWKYNIWNHSCTKKHIIVFLLPCSTYFIISSFCSTNLVLSGKLTSVLNFWCLFDVLWYILQTRALKPCQMRNILK